MKASELLALAESIVSEFGPDSVVDAFVWHYGHVRDHYRHMRDGWLEDASPEPSPELLSFVMSSIIDRMTREESEFTVWKHELMSEKIAEFVDSQGSVGRSE